MIDSFFIYMDSQTPITDEIQTYGVLEETTLEALRMQEIAGELKREDLYLLREKIFDLKQEEMSLLQAKNDFILLTKKVGDETKKETYHQVESLEHEVEENNADQLLKTVTL